MSERLLQELGLGGRVRDGEPGADGLLLVHGLGADATFWNEAFARPGLERYTLVAVDLPGFGGAPPLRPLTFAAVLDRLAALVDALAVPVVAVGHSMGGTIAAAL